MSRHFFLIGASMLYALGTTAQMQKQTDTSVKQTVRIIPVEKATLLKNVAVIFNMQYSNNDYFQNGQYTSSNFAMNQFRLEIRGEVFDHVYFRFRNRYTREPVPQSVDNISYSTDLAFVGIDVSPKVGLAFGKMCADYGGYEFDANPIDIYQYNDIVNNADNFLTGAQVSWKALENHQFTFQVLNARTQSFTEIYDTIPGVTAAKFPAMFVGNWRGSFAKGAFTTLWSYAFILEASHEYVRYTALGNQLSLKKWLLQYDFKYMNQDIDRTGLVTTFIPKTYDAYTALGTKYVEHWLNVEYGFHEKWKAALIGMVSDAYWSGNPDPEKNSHLRTAWGVIPSVQFFPFKGLNLKFFAAYVGRFYNYTDYARMKFGSQNSTTGQIMLGFISPLVVL